MEARYPEKVEDKKGGILNLLIKQALIIWVKMGNYQGKHLRQ